MSRIFRVLVVSAAALIAVLGMYGIEDFSRSPYTGINHHNLVIREIERGGPNDRLPLHPGDKILAVDGIPVRNLNHFQSLVHANTELRPQRYTVARGDSVFEVTVESAPQSQERIHRKFSFYVVACTFILVGLIVALKRPDILGMLFTVNCFLFSFIITERPISGVPLLHIVGELVYDFFFIFLPAFFLHFFLLFPGKEIERGTRRARAVGILYLPPAVLSIVTFVLALYKYGRGIQSAVESLVNAVTAVYWSGYMIISLIVFVRTYLTSGRGQKIKFRLVMVGLALGVLPLSAVILIKQFYPAAVIPHQHVSVLFLAFVSISFAHAILKHDAFDLGLVFRRGLVLVVASGLLVALYYVLFDALLYRLGAVQRLERSLVAVIAIMLLGVAFMPARELVARVVDRAMNRRRPVSGGGLIDFSRGIHGLLSAEQISRFIPGHIRRMFDAEHVHLFLRDEGGVFRLSRSSPEGTSLPLTVFPPDTELMELVKVKGLPLMMEYFDTLWIKHNLDRISRELLVLSAAAVVVPLIDQHELLGFLLVGGKTSREPYTREESELFELIGERSASSIRNIELVQDSVDKQRLHEELLLAKSIQERLLPTSPPRVCDAEIAGRTETSKEVGGDFYDFVDLSDDVVGIAVADVSGKGIPAAMLMTTLQAMFRAEASGDRSTDEVLTALSRSLLERSDTTRFASFFYAIYDGSIGVLRYTNGGAFPPFVITPDGRLNRLQRGGILLGIEENPRYNEGVIKLRPGDLLVMYTDGVIDQENEKGEHFGEERLIEFLRNNLQLSITALLDKLFATVVAFGINNLKDDMTVVLLRNGTNQSATGSS